MNAGMSPVVRTIVLLSISNVFMTFAWYGHLRYRDVPLWKAIGVSWAIAFVEYCFMVPANRAGYGALTGAQLKVIQEAITLTVFCLFAVVWLKEPLRWNVGLGFLLMIAAVGVVFWKPS